MGSPLRTDAHEIIRLPIGLVIGVIIIYINYGILWNIMEIEWEFTYYIKLMYITIGLRFGHGVAYWPWSLKIVSRQLGHT